jgi:hypothetical protein
MNLAVLPYMAGEVMHSEDLEPTMIPTYGFETLWPETLLDYAFSSTATQLV